MFAGDLAATLGDVAERDHVLARAVEDGVLHGFGQLAPRRFRIEAVVLAQGDDQLEVMGVATVPAADGTARETQLGVADHACRIEDLRDAEAIAGWAGADRGVEREQARLELRERVVAQRARVARREQLFRRLGVVHVDEGHDTVAEAQGGLERLGKSLLDVFARTKTVDDRLDRVLLAQRERRYGIEVVDLAIDAGTDEALRAQLVEHLDVLALALADDGRQEHPALVGIQRHGGVDHLADGLRLERDAVCRAAGCADTRIEQAQVVVHLGDRTDGGSRVMGSRLLLDRNGR